MKTKQVLYIRKEYRNLFAQIEEAARQHYNSERKLSEWIFEACRQRLERDGQGPIYTLIKTELPALIRRELQDILAHAQIQSAPPTTGPTNDTEANTFFASATQSFNKGD